MKGPSASAGNEMKFKFNLKLADLTMIDWIKTSFIPPYYQGHVVQSQKNFGPSFDDVESASKTIFYHSGWKKSLKKERFKMKRPPLLNQLPILKLLVQSCMSFFIDLNQNGLVIF